MDLLGYGSGVLEGSEQAYLQGSSCQIWVLGYSEQDWIFLCLSESESASVVSDSLLSHGLYSL